MSAPRIAVVGLSHRHEQAQVRAHAPAHAHDAYAQPLLVAGQFVGGAEYVQQSGQACVEDAVEGKHVDSHGGKNSNINVDVANGLA